MEAAEAMVQLSGIGFYSQPAQQDESIDFDPNYDPSDFLMKKREESVDQQYQQPASQQYQMDSYEFSQKTETTEDGSQSQQQSHYASSFSQPYDFNAQQTQPQPELEIQEPQPPQQQQISGSILEDLEISDSDEEDQKMEIFNASEGQSSDMNASKEEDVGLWF